MPHSTGVCLHLPRSSAHSRRYRFLSDFCWNSLNLKDFPISLRHFSSTNRWSSQALLCVSSFARPCARRTPHDARLTIKLCSSLLSLTVSKLRHLPCVAPICTRVPPAQLRRTARLGSFQVALRQATATKCKSPENCQPNEREFYGLLCYAFNFCLFFFYLRILQILRYLFCNFCDFCCYFDFHGFCCWHFTKLVLLLLFYMGLLLSVSLLLLLFLSLLLALMVLWLFWKALSAVY